MNVLAINGSPRKNWNTSQLLEQVVAGAAAAGAQAELVHLRDATFTGCISCFHCKDPKGKSYGRCILKDGLTPILDKAHEADVIVLGAPIYFSVESSLMRACMERLCFQYYLYSNIKPPLSPRKKATALVYTMNVPQEHMATYDLDKTIKHSQSFIERVFAPCEIFLSCDTLQFKDYSKYDTDYFDEDAKHKRHNEIFPQELKKAFTMGERLVK